MQAVITTYFVVSSLPVVIEDEIDEALSYSPGAIFQASSNNASIVRLLSLNKITVIPATQEFPGATVIQGPPGPPGDAALVGWERIFGQVRLITTSDVVSMGHTSPPPASKVNIDAASGGFAVGLTIVNGTITVPGAGTSSERFGIGALAAGDSSLALGNAASAAALRSLVGGTAGTSTGVDSVLLGASGSITADQTVLVGAAGSVTAAGGLAAGYSADVGAVDASAWGRNATSNFAGSHAWGAGSITTAPNQFVFGASADPISAFYLGKGEVSTAKQDVTIAATRIATTETDGAGSSLIIETGPGTGNATPSTISFRTAPAGASGTTQQVLATQLVIGAGVDVSNWLNIGTTTVAAAIGDLAASDGTNLFSWDASTPRLSLGVEGAVTQVRGIDATTGGVAGGGLTLTGGSGLTTGAGGASRVAGGASGPSGIGGLAGLTGGTGIAGGGAAEVIGGTASGAPGGVATLRGGPGAPAGNLIASGGITNGIGGQSGTGTFSGGNASPTLISLAGDGVFKGGDGVSNNNNGANALIRGGLGFGAGTHGLVQIETAGVARWQVDNTGKLLAVSDNSFDIGAAASGRARDLFVGRNAAVAGNLVVSGTTTIINSALQTADNYILLNSEYTSDPAQTGGLVINVNPAPTTFPISGIASDVVSVSAGDPSASLSPGDFVLLQGPANADNAGLYEVLSTTVSSITIDSTPAEVFTGSGLADDATAQGTILGTAISVIRTNTAGTIQQAFGSAAPLVFSPLGGGGGGETLAQTLLLGAVTGGTDVTVTTGDAINGASELTLDAAAAINVGTSSASAVNIAAPGITTTLGETVSGVGANAASWGVDQATAVIDFSVSGTASGVIPAGAMVVGVSTRILTTISGGGATGYEVGDGSDVDRWGTRASLVIGQITDPRDYNDNTLSFNNSISASDIVLTGIGGVPTGGTIRIVLTFMSLTAPTS